MPMLTEQELLNALAWIAVAVVIVGVIAVWAWAETVVDGVADGGRGGVKMSMELSFSIPGQPVAKGRPKFARRGNFVTAYTPAKTQNYENLVKLAAFDAMQGREPSALPLEMEVCLWLQIPASWSNKKRAAAAVGQVLPTKKPDADNCLKALKDGCNGIVWRDDAQVVSIILQKKYSETPMASVIVRELSGESA